MAIRETGSSVMINVSVLPSDWSVLLPDFGPNLNEIERVHGSKVINQMTRSSEAMTTPGV